MTELEQIVTTLTAQVAALLKQNQELTERLGRNSRNSNLPPSSDPIGGGRGGKGSKGPKKRGGQPGHTGRRRELVPPDRVDKFEDLFPPDCENCWAPLPEAADLSAQRHQLIELPPLRAHITEFRRHTVKCSSCGHKTCAAYDPSRIPASPFGPRLMSVIAPRPPRPAVPRAPTSENVGNGEGRTARCYPDNV